MNSKLSNHLLDLPIYKKAMDIIMLSHSISTYLHTDLCLLSTDGKEDTHIYFSGDIVQQSTELAPEILNVEREHNADKKQKHLERLEGLTYRLSKNCKRLEQTKSNGKDYLPILNVELKKFKTLKQLWLLTL